VGLIPILPALPWKFQVQFMRTTRTSSGVVSIIMASDWALTASIALPAGPLFKGDLPAATIFAACTPIC
jgi:hypothetical protein